MDNDQRKADDDAVTLYYSQHSFFSQIALMALYERGVKFVHHHINLKESEQYQRWFLQLNPKAEVPILKHGEKVIVDSAAILDYLENCSNLPLEEGKAKPATKLFPENDRTKTQSFMKLIYTLPMAPLTFGAAFFHTEHVTSIIRWPLSNRAALEPYMKVVKNKPAILREVASDASDMPAGRILMDKAAALEKFAPMFSDLKLYQDLLDRVETVLDKFEAELAVESRLGPWLCGLTFTAADIVLSEFLLRMYQVGLDQRFWGEGKRPHLAVYQEMAFSRPSFEKVSQWKEHRNEFIKVSKKIEDGSDHTEAAMWGLGVILFLGAVYTFKKLRK